MFTAKPSPYRYHVVPPAPPRGLEAFDVGECYDLLSTIFSVGSHALAIIESDTGDLRDYRFVYRNPAFKALASPEPDQGATFSATILTRFFADPCILERVYESLDSRGSANEEHLARGQDGTLRMVQIDLHKLAVTSRGAPRWLIFLKDVTDFRGEGEQQLRTIFAKAHCLVWHAIVNDEPNGMKWELVIYDEQAAERWLPIDVPDGKSFTWAWTVMSRPPEEMERMDAICHNALRGGLPGYSQEYSCTLANGEIRWLAEDVQIDPLGEGRWRLVGVCSDITARKQAEDMLADERNLLRTVIDNVPISIYYKDPQGRFLINNAAHVGVLGIADAAEAAGKSDYDFFPASLAAQYEQEERAVLESGMPLLNKEEPFVGRDGARGWLSTTKVPLRDHNGSIIGLLGICQDITQEKAMDAERDRMLTEAIDRADRDPLTGLLNHRSFHKRLKDEADQSASDGSTLAVAVMDMDNFKFFNDAYGHGVGDSVLCRVAQALQECCRPGDALARFGGDEFALLMPATNAEQCAAIVNGVIGRLERIGYQPPDYHTLVPLTVSVGTAVFPDEAKSRIEMLSVADDRLLRDKTGGCDAELFSEDLRTRLSDGFDHFSMLNALVSAVDTKDRYTRRHSQDVLTYSVEIASELGFDDSALFYIQVAALLHDVGKIGVPDAILRKPGRLSVDEFNAIKQHPVMGAIMVGAVPGFEPILDAVRHHHERWDGKGYPDGLAGESIPLTARLMAVADSYSAMTTDRPYRKGMDPAVALKVLQEGVGTQWDPHCVEAFLIRRKLPEIM